MTDYPKAITLPEGAYVDIVRDPFGKPTSITRRNSGSSIIETRTYAYNANQELCRVAEPETGATLSGYDAAGNLAWSASGLPSSTACDAEGDTVAILARKAARTYDARNRIGTLTFPDANGNQSWSYTPDGLPSSVTTYNDAGAASVVNTYTYNKRRLLTAEVLSQTGNPYPWTLGYGYDANGSPASVVYPANLTVTFSPNALGQPTLVSSATKTFASGISYFPNGALAQFTYGNGIVHTLTQNARGLPERSRDASGSLSIHDDSYDYDQAGNVVAISDGVTGARGNRDMVYDDLDRLASATSPMFGTASYSYDVLDNLTHVQVTGGSQSRNHDYCYDTTHWQLTNVKTGGCSTGATVMGLGYDVQGNLDNRNGVAYAFDYGNRLRSGGPESYRYDAYGRRVRSSTSGGLLYSMYSQAGQLLWLRDERAGQRRSYVYLQGSLLAEHRRPIGDSVETVIYQHTDALGSPVATTNSTRIVLQRSEYEPYGALLNRPIENGPGYTGHVTDVATGMVYMQQRYMDPVLGRFLSVDPVTVGSAGGNFNRYWYANNNPYRFTDPDGRQVSAPHSCHSDNTCIPLNQVKRDDAAMMTKLVLPPVVAGSGAGVAAATGAAGAAVSASGRVATAVDAKYTALGISALKVAQSAANTAGQVAQTAANTAVKTAQAVATKAIDLKDQAMTSSVAIASMKYRDQIVDAVQGVVGELMGVEGPASSPIEVTAGVATGVVMDETNTGPLK